MQDACGKHVVCDVRARPRSVEASMTIRRGALVPALVSAALAFGRPDQNRDPDRDLYRLTE